VDMIGFSLFCCIFMVYSDVWTQRQLWPVKNLSLLPSNYIHIRIGS